MNIDHSTQTATNATRKPTTLAKPIVVVAAIPPTPLLPVEVGRDALVDEVLLALEQETPEGMVKPLDNVRSEH